MKFKLEVTNELDSLAINMFDMNLINNKNPSIAYSKSG